jgi:aminobenzoyl-glutamate utilization protein B
MGKQFSIVASLLASVAIVGTAQAGPLDEASRGLVLGGVDAAAITSNARQIWGFAEVGYQEKKSSALLAEQLRKAGFEVTMGVAGEPTGFVALFRNGAGPVVAMTAEFDALPGLAQQAIPTKTGIAGQPAGHGCGHNLLGSASVGAAIAVKRWMQAAKISGEIRLYGTPAEEGGAGKAYMVRDGLFKDVDVTLAWHPGNANTAVQSITMANSNGKFRFHGISSHAAAAPEKGRSALDGVEIFDVAANFMREHVPDRTRIHYVITSGGGAPNVVPDYAEVYYYVRSYDPKVVLDVMGRLKKAAQGAAMATETTQEFEQIGGVYSMLVNDTLGQVVDRNMRAIGGLSWTPEEIAFGQTMQKSLPTDSPPLSSVGEIEPYSVHDQPDRPGASTDLADISWNVPTVSFNTATFVPGSPGHSWANAAAAGSSIGFKGAVLAAQTLALSAAEVMQSPDVIAKAKAEFLKRRGPDFIYQPMVGNRKPALDYRINGQHTAD